MEMRACSKCGEVKPLETNFYRNRNSRGGWTAHCRACHFKRPRKPPRAPDGYKKCTKCGEIKPATGEFWFAMPRGKYGLDARCKPCKNESIARFRTPEKRHAFYEKNKERLLPELNARAKRRRSERPGDVRAAAEAWRGRNRAEIRRKHKEWCAQNREQLRLSKRASQAKRRAATGSGKHSAAHIRRMMTAQKERCWWCQKRMKTYHVDHRIPLAKGGGNGPNNLVLACPTCNLRKSSKMPWQIDNPRLL